jgi:hypothetical protein
MFERLSLQKLHGRLGFVSANFVNGADVGMVQSGGGFGFTTETFEGLWIVGQRFSKDLRAAKRPSSMSSAL